MPKDYPCRPRRRQEPFKNLTIITTRLRIRLVRVVNYCPCQPHAGATATPEKKIRNRAKGPKRPPEAPGPPPAPTLIHVKRIINLPYSTLGRTQRATPRRAPPRGRRTSSACGSFRRPPNKIANIACAHIMRTCA